MSIIIKSSDTQHLSLPSSLLSKLNLRDGDEVKVTVDGDSIRIERLDAFLSLRGALAEDESFDQAMKLMEQAWQAWTTESA